MFHKLSKIVHLYNIAKNERFLIYRLLLAGNKVVIKLPTLFKNPYEKEKSFKKKLYLCNQVSVIGIWQRRERRSMSLSQVIQ